MKPITKYQGGKSRELPLIRQLLPKGFDRVIEPFCGGAAVSFGLGYTSLLSDINRNIINLYSVVADEKIYPDLQVRVDEIKLLEHNDLEREFYAAREVINQPWDCASSFQKALSYIVVRQLCFSGMERYNAKGDFNVPFGHYKKFSCNLSSDHHEYLKEKSSYKCGNFVDLFDQVVSTDFVFIDPPYLGRLGYTTGDGGLKLHEDLLNFLKATKGQWMIIHSDHEFYREGYKNFNILERDFAYAQRFGKGKDHTGAKVKHLYITNYDVND